MTETDIQKWLWSELLISITTLTRSPSASLQIKGLVTKYKTVKLPFQREIDCLEIMSTANVVEMHNKVPY